MEVDVEIVGKGARLLLHVFFFLLSFSVSNIVSKNFVWNEAQKLNLSKMGQA